MTDFLLECQKFNLCGTCMPGRPINQLDGLEAYLRARIIGQDDAVQKFASALQRTFAFNPRPGRSRLLALLLGPTGTGKTEIVNLSVGFIYKNASKLERLDLGEYTHADSVQRLLGGGGERSTLGAALDRLEQCGGGVLLLDELEKAHASLWPVLLGFDAGRVTLAGEVTRSLENIVVVMTSNLGSAEAARMEHAPDAAVERHVLRTAERALRPEMFARFSERIVFRRLDVAAQRRIADLRLSEELRLRGRELHRVLLSGRDAGVFLSGEGFSAELGARPLRRAIEMHVATALLEADQMRDYREEACPLTRLDNAWILDREGNRLRAFSAARIRVQPIARGTNFTHEHTTP